MGWAGIVVLGLAVGLAGWWLHPLRRSSRAGLPAAWVAGVVAAAAAKMLGDVSGLFHDGETLQWPVCTGFALVAVALTVALGCRR
ncbi:hypothetical protein C0Z18_10090 [Trinickia dabaoshanensis]|uniref:GlsB/YeaQ/YmgE family stress response membrane protein n=1 Tax=Trinickia dabaoshanensis TaxID=564714 RepID=A0A2N7VUP8_9BURK|nr:hypothetical protein [Trinickia dabaoshanensis]PMS20871.1 hypothetical protein C0Z18_10090 [Trinickia dabaoshanensis]